MPVYNKLVRDRIPEIIEGTGKSITSHMLSNDDYKLELKKKLSEEVEEYLNTKGDQDAIEELADIMEVMTSLAQVHHASIEDVEKVRHRKVKERGGFEKKIFLVEVADD